jgi:hypothetical protein
MLQEFAAYHPHLMHIRARLDLDTQNTPCYAGKFAMVV